MRKQRNEAEREALLHAATTNTLMGLAVLMGCVGLGAAAGISAPPLWSAPIMVVIVFAWAWYTALSEEERGKGEE